jgi:transposase InsO family protein
LRNRKLLDVDIVSDGETSKISYATYVKDRYTGFDGDSPRNAPADLKLFPSFLERLANDGGSPKYARPMCVGEVKSKGQGELGKDIANLQAAMAAHGVERGFMNAASPGVISLFLQNDYYPTREAYLAALADAMKAEYETIVAAGLDLQLDCPDLALSRHMLFTDLSDEDFVKVAASHVEALNHALSDVPEDRRCASTSAGAITRGRMSALEQRIREICQTRVRFGYRRVHVLLKREGWEINAKKTYRIYKELGMQLRNKTPKRRAKAKLREDRADAVRPNDVWAMGLRRGSTGHRSEDPSSHGSGHLFPLRAGARCAVQLPWRRRGGNARPCVPSYRLSGHDPGRSGQRVHLARYGPLGLPARRDPRLLSTRQTDGQPFIEAFNGRFRAECLNSHWFMSLEDATEQLEAWRRDYNEERPQSAIGHKVPADVMKSAHDTSQCT